MQMIHTFFLSLVFAISANATGGWVSGGGELFKDAQNPWFLNNVSDVYYCIKTDKKNFGASEEAIEKNINLAISYWKSEFNNAIFPELKHFGYIKIASQNFIKTGCEDNRLDLSFQFGYLTKKQRDFLREPKKYAAVSVRTDYDLRKLKAKGFIYISPSNGELSYYNDSVIRNAWSKNEGNLLYLALVHELGHVFGLGHSGAMGSLMSEGFLDTMLRSNSIPDARELSLNFFTYPSERFVCPKDVLLKLWQNFFDLTSDEKCLKFQLEYKTNSKKFGATDLSIYSYDKDGKRLRTVKENINLILFKFNPVVANVIWLTPEQMVFQGDEYIDGINGVLGVTLLSIGKKGFFTSDKNFSKRMIAVKFEQGTNHISIEGIDENFETLTFL